MMAFLRGSVKILIGLTLILLERQISQSEKSSLTLSLKRYVLSVQEAISRTSLKFSFFFDNSINTFICKRLREARDKQKKLSLCG